MANTVREADTADSGVASRRHNEMPIDKGWAWMVMLAGIGVTFLMIGNIKSFGIFFVAFIEEYGANASMTSSLQGIQFGIYSFSSLFVLTLVVSRIDHRTAVCIGGVMSCVGYIVTAFAPNVDFMVLSQGVILGIANSLILGPTLVLVGKYFDKRRGLANGLVMSGGSLGALLLPMLLRYILDEYGLRGSLIIIGGLSLNNLVSAALLREPTFYSNTIDTDSDKSYIKYDTEPTNDGTDNEKKAFLENNHLGLDVHEMNDRRRNVDDVASNSNLSVYELQSNVLCTSIASLPVLEDVHASRQNMQGTTETRETSSGRCHSLKDKLTQFMKHAIFRNPLLYIALQGGMLICPGALSMIFLPPHAKDLKINDKNIALLMSLVGGMDFIGRVIYSLLSEIKCIQRYQFLAISAIMSGVLSNSVRLFTEFWSLSIFAVVYGLIGGGYYVLYASVLVDFLGIDNLPLTLGLLSVIHGLSLSAFLPLLGSLRDATGSYYVTYHVAGFAAISGGSLFFILKPLATRWNENHHLQNVNSKENDL